ncbi:Nitrogen regulatory protein P-II 2 [Yersinia aldovae ATCC 35236]|nr:Nitrogen regulatory protein P-II 2 [Yersinia aldovae ATCC 35236]
MVCSICGIAFALFVLWQACVGGGDKFDLTREGENMKLVTVVIKPFKLEDVREALSSVGIQGLTVTEVKGFGRQKGHAELYRGAEYSVNFLPKVKIDVAIADDQLDEVIDVISKAAYTGKIGDGKIFVAELQRVIRIRTGETDESAL